MFPSACSSFPRLPRLHGFRRISLIPHLLQSIGEGLGDGRLIHSCAFRFIGSLALQGALQRLPKKLLLESVLLTQNERRDAVDSVAMHTHCASSVADLPDYEYDKFQDDVKTVEKDAALRLALSRLAGDFGRESMLSFDGFFRSRYAPVIPTGSLKLDVALGIGGLPKGRIVEIYGKEASGKTTLAFHIIKEAQRLGGYCAYLDVENAMVASLAESIGVDTDKLLVARPDSAENSFKIVDTLAKSGSIDVIVVDSVAALVSQCEIDVLMDINVPDARSRLMTQALRKIQYSLVQSRTLLVFINQVRSRPCKGFGRTDEVSSGGNALKFYSAVRLKILRRGLLKNENEITGIGVSVQVEKNKLAPAMKKADLDIIFGRGICCESEVLEMACQHGVILKEGNSYCIEGEIFKSQHEAERHLAENDGILDKVVANLRSQLFGNTK